MHRRGGNTIRSATDGCNPEVKALKLSTLLSWHQARQIWPWIRGFAYKRFTQLATF